MTSFAVTSVTSLFCRMAQNVYLLVAILVISGQKQAVCRRGSNCRQVLCRAGQRQASDHARSGKEKIQPDREVAELPKPRSSWRARPDTADSRSQPIQSGP